MAPTTSIAMKQHNRKSGVSEKMRELCRLLLGENRQKKTCSKAFHEDFLCLGVHVYGFIEAYPRLFLLMQQFSCKQ